jgi:hypothetical protein
MVDLGRAVRAVFETIRDWEHFDADTGKTSHARSASTSFRTSATGEITMLIRKAFNQLVKDVKAETAKAMKFSQSR